MNVLSLFDGCSGGQQALNRIGIVPDKYFASEIDKYAIQVTMANYPNTIQLGSVVNVDVSTLPKIDLLCGGSPCQSFSFAGKRKGMSTKDNQEIYTIEHYLQLKSEGFEFEGQSYLFWEYMRILTDIRKINPDVKFLLENVMMVEKWERTLSTAIGVEPIMINSALVSAQNRKRLYWTNIYLDEQAMFEPKACLIPQPKDKKILLKDILETNVDEKYFISGKRMETMAKSGRSVPHINEETNKFNTLIAGYGKIPTDGQYVESKQFTGLDLDAKSKTIRTGGRSSATDKHNWDLVVHNMMPRSGDPAKGGTGHLSRNDGKTYCLDTGNTNAVEIIGGDFRYDEGFRWREGGKSGTAHTQDSCGQFIMLNDNQQKKFNPDINSDKANTLTLAQGRAGSSAEYMDAVSKIANITSKIRRLTPVECERLQTVADGYTAHVSDSQRYKMLGNGWTIDVIAHILSFMNK